VAGVRRCPLCFVWPVSRVDGVLRCVIHWLPASHESLDRDGVSVSTPTWQTRAQETLRQLMRR
jgi:hypothetical protein